MTTALKVFHYPNCSTCKKALAWLSNAGVEHQHIDIVKTPPSVAELKRIMKLEGIPVAKLFNTSGQLYREGNYKDKLSSMSEKEALDALASAGKLIKRPLVLSRDIALVGFNPAAYAAKLG